MLLVVIAYYVYKRNLLDQCLHVQKAEKYKEMKGFE